jgi:hypothetical protein
MEDERSSLLARLDERVKSIERRIENFVTKEAFWVTKVIAIGLAGLVLSTVVAIILARVIGRQ